MTIRLGVDRSVAPRGRSVGDGIVNFGGRLLGLLLGASALGAAEVKAQTFGRPSASSAETQANGPSYGPDLSGDGRLVAFTSQASNLVPGDSNQSSDVFVRDRQAGTTTRVSVGPGGIQGNSTSDGRSISRDGRLVAFVSFASNLVPGDANGTSDVFVHDRRTRTTRRVSVASDGTEGNNGVADGSSLSADGRFVVFASYASNLVAGDADGTADVFAHELGTGRTELVSVDAGGAPGNGDGFGGGVSADGRYVVFVSGAGDMVPGDTNGVMDVFVRDRQKRTTQRVSVGPAGRQGNGDSFVGALSADGRLVALHSAASNLVAGDTNGRVDVFVHDRETGRTTRVSVGQGGAQGDAESFVGPGSVFSADGRYVAFASDAGNLVPGDTNGRHDVFVHDLVTGTTRRANLGPGGAQAKGGDTEPPAISADGRFVTFSSPARNLLPGDTNRVPDIFVARGR